CTLRPNLKYGIRRQGTGTGFPLNSPGITFTCADIGTVPVEVWAIDAAGNADFCLTYVIVQDNLEVCEPSTDHVTVAGALKTEAGVGLEEGSVEASVASPTTPPFELYDLSDADGAYSFPNAVPLGSNLTVTPTKDNNPLNGVTTYDLVLISKHILGLEPLGSPYKMIAADANKSGSITTSDIVELRKLILGIYEELPNNTSWRFVDKAFEFPNLANPFQTMFPENKTVADIQAAHLAEDFVAVKIGDVNQNAIANANQAAEARTTSTLLLNVEDRKVKAGEVFEVTFKTAEAAQGFQFTLNLTGLKVSEIIGGDKVSAGNFGVFANALTVSVDDAQEFTVRFRALKGGKISEMLRLSGQVTKAEGYSLRGERQEIALRFHQNGSSVISGVGFELYQNQPNPFEHYTSIGFHLPVATTATLTVYDESGRLLFTQKGDFAKGYNAIQVERAVLNNSGVLYYQLKTATDVATRKMIQSK
ncbi:MAG: T9SS type A sorting domain-containing protein, partial [Saprospiraceae bacterium]|nr:T9SS type A sorting domain-containing protein [Saprospiraceae bacterium]